MKIKNILTLAISLTIAVTLTAVTQAQTSNTGKACEVISQYYDPNLPEEAGQASPGVKATCPANHHEAFPGTHKDDKLGENHPTPKKTTTQPISKHIHRYVNDSNQELNKNGKHFFHISVIDQFEMQLQEDFMDNVILNSVKCPNLPNSNNCTGVGSLGNVVKPSGTYKLGFITSFNKTTGVITWHFPGSQFENYIPNSYNPAPGEKWMKPIIDGNHPKLYELLGSDFDPTPEENRMLERSISFETKNIEEDFWSATVTSRILIKERVASVSSNTNSINSFDSLTWEVIPNPANQTGEFDNYFWFPIGTTTTIWERPEPEILNVCTGLDAILTDETVTINGETAHRLQFNNVTFSESIPVGLLLKWTSDDPNGTFWINAANDGGFVKIGTGTATTNLNKSIVYYIGEGKVHVQPNLPDAQVPNICKLTFGIPEEVEQVCGDLLVDHNSQIYTDTLSYFKSIAKDTENQPFPGDIKYEVSVNEDYGTFYTVKPAGIPDNTSLIIYETNPAFNIFNSINLPIFQPAVDIIMDYNPASDIINPFSLKPRKFGFASILALAIDFEDPGVIGPSFDVGPIVMPGLGDLPIDLFILKTVTVGQDEPVYFHAKKPGTNVIEVKPITTDAPACLRKFSIVESPKVCSALNLTSDPLAPFGVGAPATLSIDPVDQFGNFLPATTNFKLTTTAGGKFTTSQAIEAIIDLGNSATLNQFPIQFEGSNQDGEITVEIDPSDPAYSAVCKEELDVGMGFNCLECNFDLREFPGTTVTQLKKEEVYTVTANATYSKEVENTITYKLDPAYGTFVKTSFPILVDLNIAGLKAMHNVTPGTMAAQFGAVALANELVVEEDELVIFVTYSNAPDITKTDVLQIQATGFFNEECHKKVGFSAGAAQCNSLSVAPLYGKFKPDEDKFTIFNVSGDFKNHPGEIEVSLSGPGTLSKIGFEEKTKTLTYSNPEIENSNNNLAFSYERTEPFDENSNIEITVKAISPLTAVCEDKVTFGGAQGLEACVSLEITKPDRPWEVDDNDDEQIFQIKVQTDPAGLENQLYYNWKVDDGDGNWKDDDDFISKLGDQSQTLEDFEVGTTVKVWASKDGQKLDTCEDYIKAKFEEDEDDDEEAPKITKYIFPENHLEDLDDLINIGEKIQNENGQIQNGYVTYLIKFESGDQIKLTKIWESSFDNGKIIGDPLGGSFDFKAMRINVVDNGQHYTILQTQNYTKDNVNSNLSDKNFLENGNGQDLENYQEDYMCPEDSEDNDELCIVGNFDTVVSEFKKGNPIEFQNISDDTTIYIKYQMTNNSKIDEEQCKNLTTACGEEFNNKINFKAYEADGVTDYEDYDKARAIVICPYILTREGGDVFFYDVIDTGIDVAQCSEVKGHQGPGITPTPAPIPGVPKTGAGDIPDEIKLSLTLPSHDICKYSNLGSNIEGYNDVLKHFSSTICELRADVAKEWTESHINKSIEANITRIARFGENIGSAITLQDITQLNNLTNAQSGVFVSNSHLTIGSAGSDFVIGVSGNIPAAQTYIVRGKNLNINSDILYDETDYTDPSKIATAAFIVIDGNIVIDPSVTHIDGILMAIDSDNAGNDGKVTQPNSTTNRLTINGSLIGNVYDLFANRTGVGDPKKDQGSVTIHYDERILLNTPPGISELIDVQQTIVPN